MESIKDRLIAWGCDYASSIKRVSNGEEFYIDCLNGLDDDSNFEILKKSIKNKNYEEAFSSAHTLKGVLSNFGLTPLYNKVVEIVEPLRNKEKVNLSLKLNELYKLRNTLNEILNN